MSVYDKELVINGKAVRSPEQQVYQNMKDIKALQETIKPEYNTSAELTSSSVSVALSTTNAPSGTTEGWIITQDGLKFKITGGDETNLLLEFYCSIQGPQGEQGPSGAELEIDDSGTSATKVWSSQKVASEVAGAGKQLYQHHVSIKGKTGGTAGYDGATFITITNDNNTPINTFDLVKQYLSDKGFTTNHDMLMATGITRLANYNYFNFGVWLDGTSLKIACVGTSNWTYSDGASVSSNSDVTVYDKIIAL